MSVCECVCVCVYVAAVYVGACVGGVGTGTYAAGGAHATLSRVISLPASLAIVTYKHYYKPTYPSIMEILKCY